MTNLSITGMTCVHCKKAVEEALSGVEGVEFVEVNLEQASASVQGTADLAALITAVEEEGYSASAV